jgi:hypothetical protein
VIDKNRPDGGFVRDTLRATISCEYANCDEFRERVEFVIKILLLRRLRKGGVAYGVAFRDLASKSTTEWSVMQALFTTFLEISHDLCSIRLQRKTKNRS